MSSIKKVNCPRCGKEVYTAVKSLTGTESLKRKYEGVCSNCITSEENTEIMNMQAMAILDSARRS